MNTRSYSYIGAIMLTMLTASVSYAQPPAFKHDLIGKQLSIDHLYHNGIEFPPKKDIYPNQHLSGGLSESINESPVIISILPTKIEIKLPEYYWEISDFFGTVEINVNNGPWTPVVVGMRLPFCTKLATGFNSEAILKRGAYYCDRKELISEDYCKISSISEVHLGEDTLSYQKNRPDLEKGKLYFIKKVEVRADFRVSTPRLIAGVKGTKFSVAHYPGSTQDTIELLNGTISIESFITGDTAEVMSSGIDDAKIIFVSDTSIIINSYQGIDTTMWDFGTPFPPVPLPSPANVELIVNGENFVFGTHIFIEPQKGIEVDTTLFISSSELRAVLTIERIATAGLRDVIVINPDFQSDTLRGCVLLKPDPPLPPYVARIEPVSGEQGDTLDFSIIGEQFSDYSTITFDPPTGIDTDSLNLFYHNHLNAKLTIAGDAPTGPRDVIVINYDGRSDTLFNAFTILPKIATHNYTMADGWNMVSVPLVVNDYRKITLYTDAVSDAFTYTTNYVSKDTLDNGIGYWVKYDSAENISMTGFEVAEDTIDVILGWNMIGTISDSVVADSITSISGGIITSSFWGYNGNYFAEDTLIPGNGYWVKVSQDGSLILSSAGSFTNSNRIKIVRSGELPPSSPGCEVSNLLPTVPTTYVLEQNYPNPFNPSTIIKYQLPFDNYVTLRIYNMLGQEVATLIDGMQMAGYKSVEFNADNMPSGIYTYRLTAGTTTDVKKMMILK
jgi:hypothetical protein